MAFIIFSDSGCNLPEKYLKDLGIEVIPFSYTLDGQLIQCDKSPDHFDGHAFYEKMRNRAEVKTSLLSPGAFQQAFRPVLAAGSDILYIGLSSGISGTIHSAHLAAESLMEEFPGRVVAILDSLGAGMGEGLLACRASDLRSQGLTLAEALPILEDERDHLCEFFTVDDLMYLKSTGRVSGVTALVGTILQIKPLLRGDETGHIVVCGKSRGRKKAIADIIALYQKRVKNPETQRVFISHGDCPQDAEALADGIRKAAPPKELIVAMHEPLTGAHVGPGMLSVFFLGDSRQP